MWWHRKFQIPKLMDIEAAPHLAEQFQAHMKRTWDEMTARMKAENFRVLGQNSFGRAHTAWCLYGVVAKTVIMHNPFYRFRVRKDFGRREMARLVGVTLPELDKLEFLGKARWLWTPYHELGLEEQERFLWLALKRMLYTTRRRLVLGYGTSQPHIDAAWVPNPVSYSNKAYDEQRRAREKKEGTWGKEPKTPKKRSYGKWKTPKEELYTPTKEELERML